MNKLKPCPFCGSSRVEVRDDNTGIVWKHAYEVMCRDCGNRTVYCKTPERATELWNMRADERYDHDRDWSKITSQDYKDFF